MMSAMGQKRTLASRSGMSALPPKADMFSVEIDVCFVPLTDIGSAVIDRARSRYKGEPRRREKRRYVGA